YVQAQAQLVDCTDAKGARIIAVDNQEGYGNQNGVSLAIVGGVSTYFSGASSTAKGVAIGAAALSQTAGLVYPSLNQQDQFHAASVDLAQKVSCTLATFPNILAGLGVPPAEAVPPRRCTSHK
ncbi:MAG TPA: hypothetical protein VKG05_15070, partial [Steroidobacteraceae bacterium]|nr:hypothetical protein [Steroidobacteraceae bacterium]